MACEPSVGPSCARDAELVERSRSGSETAFTAIVDRYEAPLTRHCARIVGRADAQDAVQDAFIAAWAALRDGAEVERLRPWLFAIAQRKALTARSRRRDVELHDSLPARRSTVDEVDAGARARATLAAVAALPEAEREALVRSVLLGQGGVEIASVLGVSEPVVRQLVFRARRRIRAAAAVCALPPLTLARVLRRAIADAARRGGGLGGKLGTGGAAVKAGALITVVTVVAATAVHHTPDAARTAPPAAGAATAPPTRSATAPAPVRTAAHTRAHRVTVARARHRTVGTPVRRPAQQAVAPIVASPASPPPVAAAPTQAPPAPGLEAAVRSAGASASAPRQQSDPGASDGAGPSAPPAGVEPPPAPAAGGVVTQIVQTVASVPATVVQAVGTVVADVNPGAVAQTVGSVVQAAGQPVGGALQGATGVIGSVQGALSGATGSNGPLAGLLGHH